MNSKFSFKDLAAKAQQAGTRIASQVKEQQQKLTQRSQDGPEAPVLSGTDEFSTETENALRLVQIQNRALRDRLRATAEENERLKYELQQMAPVSPRTDASSPRASSDANAAQPRLAAVLAENERLNEQLTQLKSIARAAEEHAAAADSAAQQIESLQAKLEKASEEAAAERALAVGEIQQKCTAIEVELARTRDETAVAMAARDAAEEASHQAQEDLNGLAATVASFREAQATQQQQVSAAMAAAEGLRKENAALQTSLEKLQNDKTSTKEASSEVESLRGKIVALEQRVREAEAVAVAAAEREKEQETSVAKAVAKEIAARKEAERKLAELMSVVSSKDDHLESLAVELQEAAAKSAAAAAAADLAVKEQQREAPLPDFAESVRQDADSTIAELASSLDIKEAQLIAVGNELKELQAAQAVALETLRAEVEAQYVPQVADLQAQLSAAQSAVASAAETATVTEDACRTALEDVEQRLANAESQLAFKNAEIETLERDLQEAQSGRAAALEELRTQLEAQHAQHATQIETLQEQMSRLRGEGDALLEEIASLQTKLAEAEAAAASATQSAKEEVEWLQQGAQELQRQLEAAKGEAEEAMQHSEKELAALRGQIAAVSTKNDEERSIQAEELAVALAEVATIRSALQAAEAAAAAANDSVDQSVQTTAAAAEQSLQNAKDELAAAMALNEQLKSKLQQAEASLNAEIETLRGQLERATRDLDDAQTAGKEVQEQLTAAETAAAASTSASTSEIEFLRSELEQTRVALAAATALVAAAEPPPPSYEDMQLKDEVQQLRTDLESALQEASTAAQRAVVADAARQEASDALAAATAAAAEETSQLRSDIEAASQRINELETALASAREHIVQSQEQQQQLPRSADDKRANSPGSTSSGGGPPVSPSCPSGINSLAPRSGPIAPLGDIPALVPHHRRDPSYSSEIEAVGVESSTSPVAGSVQSLLGTSSSAPPPGLPSPTTPSPPVAATTTSAINAVPSLEERIKLLELELTDSEHTHALRDKATNVLKDEIAELRRQQKRADVDIDYLKAVLVESFASGELNPSSHMLPVLARLLQFSPEDVKKAMAGKHPPGGNVPISGGLTATANSLFGWK